MQLFSADATIFKKKSNQFFAHENIKKKHSKVAHNRPLFFFQYWPGCPNQPRIEFSYHKCVPRLICLLICAEQLFVKWLNSMYDGLQNNIFDFE